MKQFQMIKPDDFHIHLRQEPILSGAVTEVEKLFARALVMPNISPAVKTAEQLLDYKNKIMAMSKKITPLMTFEIDENSDIASLKKVGAVAAKLYPKGVTTNSENGASDIKKLFPKFDELQSAEVVLSIHGEKYSSTIFNRERDFIPEIKKIAETFPKLKIVFEHISSKDGIDFIMNSADNVYGTITLHHLLLTNNDMLASGLDPHLYCKPILQFDKDRDAIQRAVLSGTNKLFFGSDSAPHLVENKIKRYCSAGIFSTPVTLSKLKCFYEDNYKLDLLENFVSKFGADCYGLNYNNERVEFVEEEWVVDDTMFGIVPLFAGQKMKYKVFDV